MPTTFRPYQPDQLLLLSPDVREWLASGHLAHHVSDLVDALDLSAFYAPYEGDSRRNAPYEPSMMVKILTYAYATGVFSSRAIARKLEAPRLPEGPSSLHLSQVLRETSCAGILLAWTIESLLPSVRSRPPARAGKMPRSRERHPIALSVRGAASLEVRRTCRSTPR